MGSIAAGRAGAGLDGGGDRVARDHLAHDRADECVRDRGAILLVASIASLAGVALLVAHPPSGAVAVPSAVLAVGSVVASWFLVHTTYTLQYAALYYTEPKGGIDFDQQEDPLYLDFAYMGFSLGMTYQVSDTSISSTAIRVVALRPTLLAFHLGAVILASTLNLVVGLANT